MSVPGRQVELHITVSAPAAERDLPVMLLSHGHGNATYLSSLRGYGPLADFYAAHGFVVIQPTHPDSKALSVDRNGPEGALFWRSRAEDMRAILDHLPHDGTEADLADSRVKAGVLLAAPGQGDLAAFASEHYPVLGTTASPR